MKIAVEGCAHGELENIYDSIAMIEQRDRIKVDLLLCCGDFQSTRNEDDMGCMAIPQKYLSMCTFYKYYSGEKVAPILTLFIGGNHEASNYLQELAFGGWVAPNIYYVGNAGILDVAGVRIGGISGIFKGHDYLRGRFELPPYTENTKRSVYHTRNVDVFRLKQVKQHIDIFMSHDWPRGIYNHGDANQLIKKKPFFREEVNSNSLGSGPASELLHQLKPSYWFAAHLHVKFAALVTHQADTDGEEEKETRFLALDKCLPRRQFLQVVDVPHDQTRPMELCYDAEWLSVLFRTNHLTSVDHQFQYLPVASFSPSETDMEFVRQKFANDLTVPCNFTQTVDAFDPSMGRRRGGSKRVVPRINPQTMTFCERLSIDDPMAIATGQSDMSLNSTANHPDSTYQSFCSPDVTAESSTIETTPKRFSLTLPSPVNQGVEEAGGEDDIGIVETKPKRFSLSLPSPLNEGKLNEVGVEESESITRLGLKASSDTESPKCLEEGEVIDRNSVEEKEEIVPVAEVKAPQAKKFKRRNQEFYANTEEF